MGRFSCSLAVFRRSWPGAYGIYVGSAAAALTCRGAACLLAHAPLTIPAIPTTCPPSFDDITTRTGRGPDRPRACPAAIPDGDECGCFPKAPGRRSPRSGTGSCGACAVGWTATCSSIPTTSADPRGCPGGARQTSVSNLPGHAAVQTPRTVGARALWGMGWAVEVRARRTARGRHRALRVPPPGSTA
jgi:hypothetical protein